ncbi:DUF4344 domain-containing metallopeptidase [Enterovibrio coralii]|uniref:Metallopeptidase n=1 Tax=Enterovibrio coralii TaxID=294935 RepID=A0A135I4E7_9GAMM|nr:DUF4344 domain-containing metallopeptidase [Enterovibrio coralii]KXF80308.1 hypothetical protein ATN88_10805 [Enterovibrio coralii]
MRAFVSFFFFTFSLTVHATTQLHMDSATGDDKQWQQLAKPIATEMVKFANQNLRIEDKLTIRFDDQDGPLFDPETFTIHIPYQFLKEVYGRYAAAEPALEGVTPEQATQFALLHTLLHEYGHAYIYSWDIPIVGKEEDAVDNFATVLLLNDFKDDDAAFIATDLFALEDLDTDYFEQSDFWDEHSLDAQRYAASLCLIYGSNPNKYKDILDVELKDMERDAFCVEDYETKSRNWARLIETYSGRK